jgi:ABC-type transport system substrate-binding protein
MRMHRRVRLAAVVVMAAATIALTAGAGAAGAAGNILPKVTTTTGPKTPSGTLTIVGNSDVDHLDTCCAYYTTTYELLRMVSRQLVTYRAGYTSADLSQVVPDLASSYTISPNGLTYTFHIRQGVDWDTPSGPRQVTGQDEVNGIKRLCNPVNGAPPIAYWTGSIAGMADYCKAFQALSMPTDPNGQIAAIKNFVDTHNVSGLSAPNASTIVFTLIHPSSTFLNVLAMPMSSPVPIEIFNYVPASVTEEENFISDGPYTITSYTPNVSYALARNPYWSQSTDPIRHQYFDNVSITMGESATAVQQQLETGAADMEWDTTVPTAEVPGLVASHNPDFAADFFGGIQYLVFNMKSTTDGGALKKVAVRQALQFCVNKQHWAQVTGGLAINQPSNQILPPSMTIGYKAINPYPSPNDTGNPAKCKSMLAAAGYPHGLTLTYAYPNNPPGPAQAAALQSDMAKGGVTLKLNEISGQGPYFDLLETPNDHSKWDLAVGLWFPDWTGNGAATYFSPLFDGRGYAAGSTDYGDYNDPTVDKYIDTAEETSSLTVAATNWAKADAYIMEKDPGWVPLINNALPQFIGSNVVHGIYVPFLGGFDPTNLWVK